MATNSEAVMARTKVNMNDSMNVLKSRGMNIGEGNRTRQMLSVATQMEGKYVCALITEAYLLECP